jgi:hypothetical protein
MSARALLPLLLLCMLRMTVAAQSIRGEVLGIDDKQPVQDVAIENIYTSLTVTSAENGGFLIAGSGGQLLEFKKPGYKTARVRIPQGYIPSYFRILMQKGISPIANKDVYAGANNRYDPREDSIRYRELFKHELDFPKMSTLDMIKSPFSALSKKNRQIWQFQEDYDNFQKEKYVDRTFNENTVARFTGLTGDSLHVYMRRYRPTYEQLRGMNDYTFYNFVKTTAQRFRSRDTPRGAQ